MLLEERANLGGEAGARLVCKDCPDLFQGECGFGLLWHSGHGLVIAELLRQPVGRFTDSGSAFAQICDRSGHFAHLAHLVFLLP
ncbi:hypothetical protein SDC9_130945 [bioreactor metagenome]|uniref:Uncharacterized protein n=1 Tax=bioreactor metagenome TaxID=1076179 RepID=A0A645D3D0_9ZZZZ